jgi:hypothetical protein
VAPTTATGFEEPNSGIFARGVPMHWPDALPISAERAVRFAYDLLGVRVAEVPELYARGERTVDGGYRLGARDAARYCNRWRLVLESDVSVFGATGVRRTEREVFVGAVSCSGTDVTPNIQLPVAGQPLDIAFSFIDQGVVPAQLREVRTTLASPTAFELAVPAPR